MCPERRSASHSLFPGCPASQLHSQLPHRCEATQFDGYTKEHVSLTELHRFPVGARGRACIPCTSTRARLAPCLSCLLWQLAPGPDGAICLPASPAIHAQLGARSAARLAPALDLHPVLPPSCIDAGQPEQAVPAAGDGAERNQQPRWGAQGGWAGAGRAWGTVPAATWHGAQLVFSLNLSTQCRSSLTCPILISPFPPLLWFDRSSWWA